MSPNVNPYYDHGPAHTTLPAPVPHTEFADSGMPGWMPVSALFVGLGLFAFVVFGAAMHSGGEANPAQGQQHSATEPGKTNAAQPQAAQAQAQQQGQQSPGQQQKQDQKQAAQPPNPTATTGASPAKQ